MKKAISIFLTLLLVACSIAQVTFADSNSPDDRSLENFINKLEDSGVSQEEIELLRQSKTEPEVVYSDTINEYKLYKELANKTDNELKSLGMSEDTIANLRNLNFTDELIKRSKLDDNALSSMGYTKKQIKMLRNFKGTESEIIALAATLSASGTVNYLYYYQSEDNSAATFSYSWSWSAEPVFKFQDAVAFAWSEDMYVDETSISNCDVYYKDYLTNGDTHDDSFYKEISIYPDSPNGAASFTFEFLDDNGYPAYDMGWAKSGSAYVRVTKEAEVREVAFIAKYGHSRVSASPSFTFSSNPLSVTFEGSVDNLGQVYKYKQATVKP